MEFVYVVKRYDLFDLAFPHGFVTARDEPEQMDQWNARMRAKGFFVERRWAEQDSSLKQIIPYNLIVHGDEIYLLKRLDSGGESRLHGKLSIGVGGHINPVDEAEGDLLDIGCRRELDEELNLETPFTLKPAGVINDESNDVGSVHIGLVNLAHCETRDVTVRETDQLEGGFVTQQALQEMANNEPDRFESWSTMIISRLGELLP
ncbi:MAG: hypothetical protein VX916_01750 [Planctomycetota bacterium]|nr:hypothetical protein [Planctomycetota bacterium]